MDTSTLVVGHVVLIESGCYGDKGKVSTITPSGVDVQIYDKKTQTYSEWAMHFDSTGLGRETESTHECGPWHIVGPYTRKD